MTGENNSTRKKWEKIIAMEWISLMVLFPVSLRRAGPLNLVWYRAASAKFGMHAGTMKLKTLNGE
jgi:hypothetical protein